MPTNQHLLALLMARSTVDRVSGVHGVQTTDIRTLGAVQALKSIGKPATVAHIAELLGLSALYDTHHSIVRLRALALVDVGKTGNRLLIGLSPAGLRLVGLLEREERDARRRIQSVTETRRKRAYVKSGKFVGKAAKQKERKQGG